MNLLNNKVLLIKKLKENRYILEPEKCWLWTGTVLNNGYGQYMVNYKRYYVHRLVMYAFKNFDLNSKLDVLHIIECKRKNCFNPEHLYFGDDCDNQQDKLKAGTNTNINKTHCPSGHLYDSKNTYINKDSGARGCKVCRIARTREYRKRLKDKDAPAN